MVDRTVANALLFHATDDPFKGVQVLRGVSIHLNIADMTGVGQGVIRCFNGNLVIRGDGIIHRHMERIGVVIPVGNPLNNSISFFIYINKTS